MNVTRQQQAKRKNKRGEIYLKRVMLCRECNNKECEIKSKRKNCCGRKRTKLKSPRFACPEGHFGVFKI